LALITDSFDKIRDKTPFHLHNNPPQGYILTEIPELSNS